MSAKIISKNKYDVVLKNFEKVLSWSRYLHRTVQIQELFLKENARKNSKSNIQEMIFLSHALLYVCIESYKEYKFNDKIIDILLGSDYANQIDVLRRMRNSIFHPNDEAIDKRQIDYLNAGKRIIPWTFLLLSEFERFLYFYAEDNNASSLGNVFRKNVKSFNNWLPGNSFIIKQYKAHKKLKAIREYNIRNYPEKSNEYTQDFKNSIDIIDNAIMDVYNKLVITEEILT